MVYYCVGCKKGECKICVRYINITKKEKCQCESIYHKENPVASVFDDPKKSKKQLEDKIQELEGKLSTLSSQLSSPDDESVDDIIKQLDDPLTRLPPYYRLGSTRYGRSRAQNFHRNKAQTPRGSLPKGFGSYSLEEMERDYNKKISERKETGQTGTLPKGFGSTTTPYLRILSRSKKEAKKLQKRRVCQGCLSILDARHDLLCHECANENLTEEQLHKAIREFHKQGLYKHGWMKDLMIKLKLAEERK